MRSSDWSSDVCSSDLDHAAPDRIETSIADDWGQDRRGHQDDGGRRQEAAGDQQQDIDEQHQHPAVDLQRGDPLRNRLGDEQAERKSNRLKFSHSSASRMKTPASKTNTLTYKTT